MGQAEATTQATSSQAQDTAAPSSGTTDATPPAATPPAGEQASPPSEGAQAEQAAPSTPPKSDEGGKPAETAPKAAPESYTISAPSALPADTKLAEPVVGAFSEIARKHGLSQDDAQALVDTVLPAIYQSGQEANNELVSQWEQQVQTDKELGGEKLPTTLANGKRALDAYGDAELRGLLTGELGLGNHPAVVRFLNKVGAPLREDTVGGGQAGDPVADLDDNTAMARKLYPSSVKS